MKRDGLMAAEEWIIGRGGDIRYGWSCNEAELYADHIATILVLRAIRDAADIIRTWPSNYLLPREVICSVVERLADKYGVENDSKTT